MPYKPLHNTNIKQTNKNYFSQLPFYTCSKYSALVLSAFLSLAGCVATKESNSLKENTQWMPSGSVALFRSAPAELSLHDSIALSIKHGAQVLGFGPLPTRPLVTKAKLQPSYALVIKRESGVIGVVENGRVTRLIECEGSTLIKPGEYTVEHKQEQPVWYASDEYFSARSLSLPLEGGRDRFLKGAYGSHALFLSSSIALHSAPLWSKEVGGVRLPSEELQALFSNLPLGSPVKVVD
jgi:lipoprotein-anchoring transpeptidase ErfK/SrfK